MLKLWNVFSDLVAFWSIFWTFLRVKKRNQDSNQQRTRYSKSQSQNQAICKTDVLGIWYICDFPIVY